MGAMQCASLSLHPSITPSLLLLLPPSLRLSVPLTPLIVNLFIARAQWFAKPGARPTGRSVATQPATARFLQLSPEF